MKLPREFIQLPLTFDAARMAEEVSAMPAEAWQAHPTGYAGNSAVPLVSVNGEANDYFAGPMGQTRWLENSPYLRQVLSSFGVVFGRSRLMGLAGGNEVPPHCDINYHWFTRVRIHVPIFTFPEVEFFCGDASVHMAAGEAWVFDNWKSHRVVNPTSELRVHLVADTVGSASFWSMVNHSLNSATGALPLQAVEFEPSRNPKLELERYNTPDVMHPSEMELLSEDLVQDLRASGDLNPAELVERFTQEVRAFCSDWKSLWTLLGPDHTGWSHYESRRNQMLSALLAIRKPLKVASNDRVAQKVMLARVLVACLNKPMPGMNDIQYPR